jgi:hypothetical protein
MFEQNYQKAIILAFLLAMFVIGIEQQTLASPPCDFNEGCYSYQQGDGQSSQITLNQNLSRSLGASITGL